MMKKNNLFAEVTVIGAFVALFFLGFGVMGANAQDVTAPAATEVVALTPSPTVEATPTIVDEITITVPVTDVPAVSWSGVSVFILGGVLTGFVGGVLSFGYVARYINKNTGALRTLERLASSVSPERRVAIYRLLVEADDIVELGKNVFDGIPTQTATVPAVSTNAVVTTVSNTASNVTTTSTPVPVVTTTTSTLTDDAAQG